MITKEEYPPNYRLIKESFPNLESHKPVFSYGDVIYNPFHVKLTPDIEVHEYAHSKRQLNNPAEWWMKYITDISFRLDEEIIAYGEQYRWVTENVPNTKLKEWLKEKFALGLSSKLYGNMLSYGEAESKIRNYAKSKKSDG